MLIFYKFAITSNTALLRNFWRNDSSCILKYMQIVDNIKLSLKENLCSFWQTLLSKRKTLPPIQDLMIWDYDVIFVRAALFLVSFQSVFKSHSSMVGPKYPFIFRRMSSNSFLAFRFLFCLDFRYVLGLSKCTEKTSNNALSCSFLSLRL